MAERDELLDSLIDRLAAERNRAEAEADSRVKDIVRITGLEYDAEKFSLDALYAAVNAFADAHVRARAMFDAIREIRQYRTR